MITIIRLRGKVGTDHDVEETFSILNLRRKFSCTVIKDVPEMTGMLKKIENFVSYGKITKETLIELIKKRGRAIKGKLDAEKIAGEIEKGKTLEESGLIPVFHLHPPIKGFKSIKLHYPRGDLGKQEKINELVRRML